MRLRLLSYNVHAGIGRDRRYDLQRVIDVVAASHADVVALQEVVHYDEFGSDALALLRRGLAMQLVAGPTLVRDLSPYGNALLSKWPVRSQRRHDISVAGREPRGVVEIHFDAAMGGLRILGTHLGLGRGERRRQWRRLQDVIGPEGPRRTMLLGDLNEWLPLRWMEPRAARMFPCIVGPRSFPVGLPLLRLDRICLGGGIRLVGSGVLRDAASRNASDHLPVYADIEIPTSA